jgi:hypothetical protein
VREIAVATPERGRVALAAFKAVPAAPGGTGGASGPFPEPWLLPGGHGLPTVLTFKAADALVGDRNWRLTVQVATRGAAPGRVRLSLANADAPVNAGLSAELEEALGTPAAGRSAEQQRRLLRQYLLSSPELKEAREGLDALRAKWPGADG